MFLSHPYIFKWFLCIYVIVIVTNIIVKITKNNSSKYNNKNSDDLHCNRSIIIKTKSIKLKFLVTIETFWSNLVD